MSKGQKTYKNVYTILEKVRKGEINYDDDDEYEPFKPSYGLSRRIDYWKKPDLIKPHMHYLDEANLESMVSSFILNKAHITEAIKKQVVKHTGDDVDMTKYAQKIAANYKKFPDHMKRDVFKLFYHLTEKLEFEDRTEKNQFKYKFLEKCNSPMYKIMTRYSHMKSAVFARALIRHFIMMITALEYKDPKAAAAAMKMMNGEGMDMSEADMSDMMDGMFGDAAIEQVMKEAKDQCDTIDKVMDAETQEEIFQKVSTNSEMAGNLEVNHLSKVAKELEKIRMNMNGVKEKIQKLLDKSKSFFSSRKERIHDDIFNTSDLAALEDYIFLHPHLRKFMAEDIQIPEDKVYGKIDVYVDVSGSMNESCDIHGTSGRVSKLEFAKSFIFQMKKLNMLNDIYLFDSVTKKINTHDFSIAMIVAGGGTSIDSAIKRIVANKQNSIIITDAEDRASLYSDLAYFIGVKGCRYSYFERGIREQYVKRGQLCMFDGNKVHNINPDGSIA